MIAYVIKRLNNSAWSLIALLASFNVIAQPCPPARVYGVKVTGAYVASGYSCPALCATNTFFSTADAAIAACLPIDSFCPSGNTNFKFLATGRIASGPGGYASTDIGPMSKVAFAGVGLAEQCNTTMHFVMVPPKKPVRAADSGRSDPQCCNGADPIGPSNGNEFFPEIDVKSRAYGSLSFTRSYNSINRSAESNLGPNWRRSYSARLAFEYSYPPNLQPANGTSAAPTEGASSLYVDRQTACLNGWAEIKNQSSEDPGTAAAFANDTCTLVLNGQTVSTLPIFNDSGQYSPQPSTLLAVHATRDDGRALSFMASGSTFIPEPGLTQKLEALSGGYRLTDSNDGVELYDATGKLLSITDRRGNTQTLAYGGPGGKLSTVTDNFGHTLTFAYNTQGLLASVTDPSGAITQYSYNGAGQLAIVTAADNTTRQYLYQDANWPTGLSSVVDENNQTIFQLSYDTSGRVLTSQLGGVSQTMSFVYNSDGTTTQTDPLGAVRTFGFQLIGNHRKSSAVTGTPCPECGYSKAISYDANGYVASVTDYNDHVTTYVHDARGLETSRTEAAGTAQARTITTTWHATYRLPTQINEFGRTTSFTYDSAGNQLTKTVTDTATSTARTWTSTYDSLGRMLTMNGPRTDLQDVTTYTYYSCSTGAQCGQVATVTNALGHVTNFNSYDANGRPLTITDPNGLVSTRTYFSRGWLKTVSVGGETTSYDYWPNGLLKRVTQPGGERRDYAYDAAQRLTGITDELGHRAQYTLDPMGNATTIEVFDQNNVRVQLRTREYNSLNRLWKDIGASNQTTVYGYDPNGNLTTVTDPLNRVTTNAYDALDRLQQTINPLNGVTQFGFNALDQRTSVSDPRNLLTQYTVDALDNTTQLQSPDSGTTVNTYDEAGNLKTQRDAKNQTTSYQYDALNRLTQLTRHDGGVQGYTYDQGSNGKGHLTGMTDASGATAWSYDLHGRVLAKAVVFLGNPNSFVNRYTYDSAGRRLTHTTPSNKVIGYQWSNGRISAMTLSGTPLVNNILYQPFAGAKSWTYANGRTEVYSFDLDGRVTSDPVHATIGYDAASRVTSRVLGNNAYLADSQTYGYDAMDRLNSFTGSGGPLSYLYDANGNRTRQTMGTSQVNSVIDPASNRQTSISQITPLSYDANGSLVNYGASTYSYDTLNRMSTLVRSANTLNFLYNGQGQRAKKTITNGSTTSSRIFLYDDEGLRIGEYQFTGSARIEEQVYLGDRPIVTLRQAGTYYIHTDYLNTPRQIDDSLGMAVWAWNPATFGTQTANQNPRGVGNSFVYNGRYAGQYHDIEGLINYNYFRTYIPGQGRYAESDPIGLEGGINTYAYVGGNPISFTDPMGLNPGAGAAAGAEMGTMVLPGWGTVIGGIIGAGAGAWLGWEVVGPMMNKDGSESKPDNCPSGTLPIDQAKGPFGLDKDGVHGIKKGVGAGPRTWTGIDPNGNVWTGGPKGVGENHGPFGDYLPRGR